MVHMMEKVAKQNCFLKQINNDREKEKSWRGNMIFRALNLDSGRQAGMQRVANEANSCQKQNTTAKTTKLKATETLEDKAPGTNGDAKRIFWKEKGPAEDTTTDDSIKSSLGNGFKSLLNGRYLYYSSSNILDSGTQTIGREQISYKKVSHQNYGRVWPVFPSVGCEEFDVELFSKQQQQHKILNGSGCWHFFSPLISISVISKREFLRHSILVLLPLCSSVCNALYL